MRMIRLSSIYAVFLLWFIPLGAVASETFIFDAPQKPLSVGESFTVTVSVGSTSQAMNAASGTVQVSGGTTITSVTKQNSVINFWTTEPQIVGNQVRFEGVVLNPGYQGQNGKLFTLTLIPRKEGAITLSFIDGAILANDGLGSNIIDSLASKVIRVAASSIKVDTIPNKPIAIVSPVKNGKALALPVITEYSQSVDSIAAAYIKGKGEPNALTKLSFKDTSLKSLGEQFIIALQTKKNKPTEALIKNNASGEFQYLSPNNLVAGAYNVTPYLVDEDTQIQKPGFGVQVLVNNSRVVKWLVVFINVLALLIPIVCLGVIIYFIPWYSRLRMKILNHKIALENEQLNLSEKEIKFKEERIGQT